MTFMRLLDRKYCCKSTKNFMYTQNCNNVHIQIKYHFSTLCNMYIDMQKLMEACILLQFLSIVCSCMLSICKKNPKIANFQSIEKTMQKFISFFTHGLTCKSCFDIFQYQLKMYQIALVDHSGHIAAKVVFT